MSLSHTYACASVVSYKLVFKNKLLRNGGNMDPELGSNLDLLLRFVWPSIVNAHAIFTIRLVGCG